MVKIIARELRAQSSGHCDIDPCQLLSFIEAAGMLPPYNSNANIKGYDLIYANPEDLHNWDLEK